ncbi:D-alanyl-D-alanine carboxypeptidase family protein [Anaerotignum sp.]|uniref:D-alanyl-D-alanine carboxypeptidase family protein n=1 Tax=Anaerotignum sp. TaxID=2039241 RepID=UPI003326B3C5
MTLLLALTIFLGVAGCSKEDEPLPENAVNTENTENTEKTPQEEAQDASTGDKPVLQTAFVQAKGEPSIAAASAILVEQTTGTILFDKNAKEKMYPASMTKMVTALVVMDHFNADELITVGTEINEVSLDSSKAGHILGETLTVKNLIRGLIIPSGNDSANVLAAAVAKKVENDPNLSFIESQNVFAKLMNEKAKELGAVNTHFTNAHGYHDENHYSCAYDMALFARAYLDNSTLTEIANEKSFAGNGADNMFVQSEGMKTQDYAWRSHNLLITDNEYNYSYASGIKTGFTNEAGHCVSAAAEKDGNIFIAIIFNSPDPGRWVDAKSLFEFGFNSYEKVHLGKVATPVEEVPLTKHNRLEGDTLGVVFNRDVITYLPTGAGSKITTNTVYEEKYLDENKDGTFKLKAPIAKDEKIGTVSFQVDGKTVMTEDVYAGRGVTKGTIWSNIKYFFKNFTSIIFSKNGLIGLGVIVGICVLLFVGFRILGGRRRKRYSGGYSLRQPSSLRRGRKSRRRFK